MSKLPVVSAHDFIRAVRKLGYEVDHQTGSHIIVTPNRLTEGYPYRIIASLRRERFED